MRRTDLPLPSSDQVLEKPLTHWHFSIGVTIVDLLLVVVEGIRLKLDLGARRSSRLIVDSVLIRLADLAGARHWLGK